MEHAGSFEAKSGISKVLDNQRIYWRRAKKGDKKLTHLSADLILSLVKLFCCLWKRTQHTERIQHNMWILLKRYWRAKYREHIKFQTIYFDRTMRYVEATKNAEYRAVVEKSRKTQTQIQIQVKIQIQMKIQWVDRWKPQNMWNIGRQQQRWRRVHSQERRSGSKELIYPQLCVLYLYLCMFCICIWICEAEYTGEGAS